MSGEKIQQNTLTISIWPHDIDNLVLIDILWYGTGRNCITNSSAFKDVRDWHGWCPKI